MGSVLKHFENIFRGNLFGGVFPPLDTLLLNDIMAHITEQLGREFYLHPQTGKAVAIAEGVDWNTPWLHIKPDPLMLCRIYQMCALKANFIHSRCLGCWKVVARPKTLAELIMAFDIMEELGLHSKAGIEERSWVQATGQLYGCYFYCTSKEQGIEVANKVHTAFSSELPKIEIYLKQYCTEFELKFGPGSKYQRPPLADQLEPMIMDMFETEKTRACHPWYVRAHVLLKWLRFAADHGDETFKLFTNGEPAYNPIEKVYVP